MIVDIIGAGIGGLTTGIALEKKGIQSRIFEQAKALKPVGAGIIVANNAMQVYQHLGLCEEIEGYGNPINTINITDKNLRVISSVDLSYFEQKHGVQNIAIHRGKLQDILSSNYTGTLSLDHKLTTITEAYGNYELGFANDKTIPSSLLIGADGIDSVIRKEIFNTGVKRNANQICWRGISNSSIPKKYASQLNEAWGYGSRFGFVKIENDKVYWYALKTSDTKHENLLSKINLYFKDYHPLVNELINQTPDHSIHTAMIEDLKPLKKWYYKNVCLIGDAAHATTPNLGQGACQAIEDAYYLSECMKRESKENAFKVFQKSRIKKATQVVNTSWRLGKVAHWQNPLAASLRNQLMKRTPKYLSRKQSERIFELNNI